MAIILILFLISSFLTCSWSLDLFPILDIARDWLEDDGFGAPLSILVERRSELAALIAPIAFRIEEVELREETAARCASMFNLTRTLVVPLTETHNITQDEIDDLIAKVEAAELWIESKLAEQRDLDFFLVRPGVKIYTNN